MTALMSPLDPSMIVSSFRQHGVPKYGLSLDYLPDDMLIRDLSATFELEFGVVFEIGGTGYFLIAGEKHSVSVPIGPENILLKHSHPGGTAKPSRPDVDWLVRQQERGSPQVQSVILPIGKDRITFNRNTPFAG